MKCVISPFNTCYLNIASEEYFLRTFEEDVFYLYINEPCIIIGRNQNAFAEINSEYVEKNNIAVVRRNSGGGAVYHDQGNLNFGFITKDKRKSIDEVFIEFTTPILNVLKALGVNAEFSGRNDLIIDGKKFSGNAQYRAEGKVMLHGTLLFSADLEKVSKSLNADPGKFNGKSITSVRSRVTNILPYLSAKMSMEEFSEAIISEVFSMFPTSYMYELTEEDRNKIKVLSEKKYSTREWVYGSASVFTYSHSLKYNRGIVDIKIQIDAGIIKEMRIYGDFFGEKELSEILPLFAGVPYSKGAIMKMLSEISISDYIFGLSNDEFVEYLFNFE